MPINCWADKENYTGTLTHLAELFVKNFTKFEVGGCGRGGMGGKVLGRGEVLRGWSWSWSCMVVAGPHPKLTGRPGNLAISPRLPLQDGGGHVTPQEAHQILEAGPRP